MLLAAALCCASVQLDPPGIVLSGPGATQRYIVTAVQSGGRPIDVTAAARIESSAPGVIQAHPATRTLIARAPGTAVITVRHGGATARATVTAGNRTAPLQVSFSRDVVSILTTKGCNGSSCHGSPAGQSGFKLSLFGYDPAADHEMILARHNGRRVDRGQPANSLILRKPLMEMPHGGGRLMGKQSDEYRTLFNWLDQGAPLDTDGPRIEKIEVYPARRILTSTGAVQPLAVIGRMSDSTTRDMTAEVRFAVGDTGVVSAPRDAAVTSTGRGLTALLARGMGKTATSQFIVIQEPAAAPPPPGAASNFIDSLVFARLGEVNVTPYPLTTDREFARRVFLDAIGLLPTPDELHAFLADPRPDKRARLIDSLLDRPEYASHWMVKFEDWFRNHQFNSQGRTNASFKKWIHAMVERDQPYNQTVRELLTATGDTTVQPAGNFWHPAIDFMLKTFDVNKITPTVTRLFLGVRIECAECHNHPLENLTQDDFNGMAAFFARVKVKHGYAQYRRIWYDEREGELMDPVSKKPVAPKFLGGATPDIGPSTTRREVLADWITRHPQFPQATVNRIWSEYFGTGIVEPHDDFRSTNPPSNPELLDQLGRYFSSNGYRFKALHRLILNSRVYQTASRSPDRPGESGPLERRLFARYEPRRLSAEVLIDSLGQAAGVPHRFGNYPEGTSSKDLIANNGPDYFLTTFGFPRRDILSDREKTPSLAQALLFMNGDAIRGKVESKSNALAALMEKGLDDRAIVSALWERTLSRPPSPTEWDSIQSYMSGEVSAGRERRRILEHVFWVLLNSKEFRINQ